MSKQKTDAQTSTYLMNLCLNVVKTVFCKILSEQVARSQEEEAAHQAEADAVPQNQKVNEDKSPLG